MNETSRIFDPELSLPERQQAAEAVPVLDEGYATAKAANRGGEFLGTELVDADDAPHLPEDEPAHTTEQHEEAHEQPEQVEHDKPEIKPAVVEQPQEDETADVVAPDPVTEEFTTKPLDVEPIITTADKQEEPKSEDTQPDDDTHVPLPSEHTVERAIVREPEPKTQDDRAAKEVAWRAEEAGIDSATFAQNHGSALHADVARMTDTKAPKETGAETPVTSMDVPAPTSSLLVTEGEDTPYEHLDDTKVVLVGAGLGGVATATYLSSRGLPAENMTLIDPKGTVGGQWQEANVRASGINNPKELHIVPGHHLDISRRTGQDMLDFQQGMAAAYLEEARLVPDNVTDLQRDHDSGDWIVSTAQGEQLRTDYVVLATGTPHTRPIDGQRIRSNLDVITSHVPKDSLIVERQQRMLTEDDLGSGREIVLIGLGNSTGTMLRQIQAYEDLTSRSVPHTVLSDLPDVSVHNPWITYDGHKSVFRNPKEGHLTGYSGDLFDDNLAYRRADFEGRIVPGTYRVDYDPQQSSLLVATTDGTLRPIETPHVFALLGQERDLGLFNRIGGVMLDKQGRVPSIRPADGAVETLQDGYNSNVFAAGAVAATPRDPNVSVGPGITSRLPHIALTMAAREHAKQRARPAIAA
jgi:hypothetical protein